MEQALVNVTIAPLRKEPKREATVVDEALYGMRVTILREENDFFYIRTTYHYEGYVEKTMLMTDLNLFCQFASCQRVLVKKAYADVMVAPKAQSFVKLSLTRGAQVVFLEPPLENGYTKIGLVDGGEGYIKWDFLQEYAISFWENPLLSFEFQENLSSSITKKSSYSLINCSSTEHYIHQELGVTTEQFRCMVVETALSYLGTQYRWGGKTPLGIDCSGLCSMAYLFHGIVIYRDAEIKPGFPVKEIPFSSKKPGDLLYFPGHIAMYLGEDRYVHSTNHRGSDGVVINSLNPRDCDYREDLKMQLLATGSIFCNEKSIRSFC